MAKMFTKAALSSLPPLYAQENMGEAALFRVKIFNPYGPQTIYLSEFDGEDTFFGYITGSFEDELGYFSKTELEGTKVSFGGVQLPLERDRHFVPMTLAEIKAKAA